MGQCEEVKVKDAGDEQNKNRYVNKGSTKGNQMGWGLENA